MSSKLEELLLNNGSNYEQAEEKLYETLIIGVFSAVCKDIEKESKETQIKLRTSFRNIGNDTLGARQILQKYTVCIFSESEYQRFGSLFRAYFQKRDQSRQTESAEIRKRLLEKQRYRCAICKMPLDYSKSHLDHIVPFSLVGDQLDNNYQMLCETCNTRKGDSVYYELSMLILRRSQ